MAYQVDTKSEYELRHVVSKWARREVGQDWLYLRLLLTLHRRYSALDWLYGQI
jgi:hypothetical protein